MSNVHKRFRVDTKIQFLFNAQNLQIALTTFLMKDKNIPKKYRLMLAVPMIEKVDELVDNLVYANSIIPTNSMEYEQRLLHQNNAIANCRQIHNKLFRMVMCVDSIKVEKLEQIAELLESTDNLIRAWKKSDKQRYKSFIVRPSCCTWWLASAETNNSTNVCNVNGNGEANSNNATYESNHLPL